MISYAEALATALEHARPLAVESVPLDLAHGRILAAAVTSRCPLPPFDQAGCDGYAVSCGGGELAAGSELPLLAPRHASRDDIHHPSMARRISPNSPMPPGLDAVLPLEQGQRLPTEAGGRMRLRLNAPLRAGAQVRRAGSEASAGTEILAAGRMLDGPLILLAASVGAERLKVTRRPQVAIFSAEAPQRSVADWYCPEVYARDVNASYLEMMSRTMGADVRLNQPVGSCPDYFEAMLQQAAEMALDMVICTRAEMLPGSERMLSRLRATGARILFHSVAFAPGSSVICARLASGGLFFGLLAEPAAMTAAYRFFVIPVLGHMQGRAPEKPVSARLVQPLPLSGRLPGFRRARLHQQAHGDLWVRISRSDDPYAFRSVSSANAWAVVPPDAAAWRGEARLDVYGTLPDMLDIPVEYDQEIVP